MPEWVSTSQLGELLNCSRSSIQSHKAAGTFRPGEHYRRVGIGRTGPIQWNAAACEAALAEHARQIEPQVASIAKELINNR